MSTPCTCQRKGCPRQILGGKPLTSKPLDVLRMRLVYLGALGHTTRSTMTMGSLVSAQPGGAGDEAQAWEWSAVSMRATPQKPWTPRLRERPWLAIFCGYCPPWLTLGEVNTLHGERTPGRSVPGVS